MIGGCMQIMYSNESQIEQLKKLRDDLQELLWDKDGVSLGDIMDHPITKEFNRMIILLQSTSTMSMIMTEQEAKDSGFLQS
jgi:hypothetical protein